MIRIEAQDFRAFPTIDWSIPHGLTLIDAVNHDTGGTNMSGKSTVLDAFFWARYGWLPKWGGQRGESVDSVIRRGQKKCWVRVTEVTGTDTIEIERHRPHKLIVKKNGIEQRSISQKELDELLQMTADQFLICVYLSQKRQKSFFHMTDVERTQLLSTLAGLEELDQALFKAQTMLDKHKLDIERHTACIKVFDEQIKKIPSQIVEAEQECASKKSILIELESKANLLIQEKRAAIIQKKLAQKKVYDAQLKELNQQLSQNEFYQRALESKIEKLKDQLKQSSITDPEYEALVEKVNILSKEFTAAEKHNANVKNLKHSYSFLKDRLQEAEERLKDVENDDKCPACQQNLPDHLHKNVLEKRQADVEKLKNQLDNFEEIPELIDTEDIKYRHFCAVDAKSKKHAELMFMPNQIEAEIKKEKSLLVLTGVDIKNIKDNIQELPTKLDQEIDVLEKFHNKPIKDLENQIQLIAQKIEMNEEYLLKIKATEDTLKKDRDIYLRDLKKSHEDLDEAMDLVYLFGPKGYRSVCFDAIIDRISDRAGELLRIITNNLYTTMITQTKEDSKGNIKMVLKPMVFKGSQEVFRDDLSGGAEDRIALAYDIAITEISSPHLPLILDEALSALDAVGKSEVMIILEMIAKTRPVLVIDHSSEFKAMFNQVVTIEHRNGESFI